MTTPTRRRLRVECITSNLYALGAKPALHLGLNLLQLLIRSRFEAHHEYRLSVRRADQSPPIAKEDAHAVHRDHLVPGAEVFAGLPDNAELPVVGAIDADLWCGDEARHVGQQVPNGLPGVGNDAKQPRRAVQGVIESVIALGEEHVPGHLAGNRRVSLVPVSYTHLRAHETRHDLVCRLL